MKTFKKYYNSLVHHKKYVAKEFIFETTSLLFVKISPSKVNCYEMSNWGLKDQPMASLYQSHFKLHYWPYKQNRLVRNYLSTVGKFSLNTIQFCDIVTFSDGSKSFFFKGMKITYRGKQVLPYPRKHVQETKAVLQDLREVGPTYYFAPPRVFENLLTTVLIRMEDAGWIKRTMFHYFMGVARRAGPRILNSSPVPVLDRLLYSIGWFLVYGPLKNTLGMSRIRIAYTAGEAIGPEIF